MSKPYLRIDWFVAFLFFKKTPVSTAVIAANTLEGSVSLCISVCHFALHELGGDAVVAAELEMKIDLPAAVFGSPPKVGRVYSASSGETLSQAGRRSSL